MQIKKKKINIQYNKNKKILMEVFLVWWKVPILLTGSASLCILFSYIFNFIFISNFSFFNFFFFL
ncbi:hypothetical protein GLOIN_2v1662862 [Rhizophagus irregularis DAOM 181602=DAOM 197198]|uniref:Uncharacterized protein n=1 Tax=Rhizophagus irregularis (strain DAOM 181602 / DAOM 197198 / MUCL 43194) TaxID=747089 RepID=A0A2P4PKF6_RHIID|nr:hypothetical protein GLOIN_2v1662862 [Rhizophagus irregularis DAOM 181602=DAOM 197198]POG65848.1 hypothetical protein GLOIN_2v1662862 [Rhizophagus irregularis DAOM 181602=DAOM 197198]|eukprot:XP_025172714.1 hypothetical protein GLOIN_2v1662862 [Rhizophagus irregularis DAOM 181602=DAOM 197198]